MRCVTSSSSVPAVLEWIKFAAGNSDAAKREEDISRQASLVRTVATIEPAQPFTAVVILRVAARCAARETACFDLDAPCWRHGRLVGMPTWPARS